MVTRVLQSGSSIGRYELIEPLKRGGMGELWRAKAVGPAGFDKEVVLKTILVELAEDPSYERLFVNEARVMARLSHPNVVQVFDLGREDGTWFMAMEMVEGVNLRYLLRKTMARGRLPPVPFALRAVRCVAEALVYIHGLTDGQGRPAPVVHRDINPDNILLSYAGTTKLCDFGIAKAHWHGDGNEEGWADGLAIGKLAYLAPEQVGSAGRQADIRSDIYSLGITLYEVLTGRQPFWRPDRKETLAAILAGDCDPPTGYAPWLSGRVEQFVLKAVARDPAQRFQSAGAFARALDVLLAGMPVYPSDDIMAGYLRGLLQDGTEAGDSVGADAAAKLRPDMLTPVRAGLGEETAAMSDGFSGRLEGLDIFEFLQMVLVSRRQTVLEVISREGEVARLFINDGNVVHAECCGMTGRDAFIGCLAFSGGAFSSHPWEEPAVRSIAESGEFLLLEAARIKDEAEREGGAPRQLPTLPCLKAADQDGVQEERDGRDAAPRSGTGTAQRMDAGRRGGDPPTDRGLSGGRFDFADAQGDGAGPSRHEAAVMFEKGWHLVRERQYDAARECWQQAVRLDPDNRSYQTNLEILERRMKRD